MANEARDLILEEEEPTPGGPLGAELVSTKETKRTKLLVQIRELLAEGESPEEIQGQLRLPEELFGGLLEEYYQREVLSITSKSTERIYVDYVKRQSNLIRRLRKLETALTVDARTGALVSIDPKVHLGAIKAQSEILDAIVTTGQKMNILEKAPEKRQIIAGVVVRNMDNETLAGTITGQLQRVKNLMERYGMTDMMGRPIDPPGTVPQKPAASQKPVAANPKPAKPQPEPPKKAAPPPPPPPPEFSDRGRPGFARGGAAKVPGGRTTIKRSRVNVPPPRS